MQINNYGKEMGSAVYQIAEVDNQTGCDFFTNYLQCCFSYLADCFSCLADCFGLCFEWSERDVSVLSDQGGQIPTSVSTVSRMFDLIDNEGSMETLSPESLSQEVKNEIVQNVVEAIRKSAQEDSSSDDSGEFEKVKIPLKSQYNNILSLIQRDMSDVNIIESVTKILDNASGEIFGRTCLLKAIKERDSVMTEILIKAGIPLRGLGNMKQGPIHLASIQGDVEIVRQLLLKDSSLTLERNFEGDTSAHIASLKGYQEVLETVLQYDESCGSLLLLNTKGQRPIDQAISLEVKKKLEKATREKFPDILSESGSPEVSQSNSHYSSPASEGGAFLDEVDYLMSASTFPVRASNLN